MAEAAAVVGLVASIASLVDISAKVVSRVKEFTSKTSDIPESFRALSTRLPLLTITLQRIRSQAEAAHLSEDVSKALKPVIDDTFERVSTIRTYLSEILPPDDASKLERALKALKSLAKEDKIRQALDKIDESMKTLGLSQTTRNVDTSDRILEAVSKLTVTTPTPSCPSSNIPFRRDPDFVDRGAILNQLCQRCIVPASRTALVGLGGIGKSQLAIEFGYRTRERSPSTWVLWIHAGSTARLELSFRNIADYVQIPGRQDPKANVFKLVHDWLAGPESGHWLLILDNVDETHFLAEAESAGARGQEASVNDGLRGQPISAYFPQSQNGSILITSRSKAVALKLLDEERDLIEVDAMSPSDALALFEKKLGPLSEGDDVAKLLEELDFMPLAIIQAAAYILQRAPRYSVRRYSEEFRKNDRKKTSLLNHERGQLRRDREAQNSIILTWQISFEHIQQSRPSAADLLSLMSFCDRQGIPENLVRNRTENVQKSQQQPDESDSGEDESEDGSTSECSDDGFEEDLHILRNYSFLSLDKDQTFGMHALVQLATRKWLEANGKFEQWKSCYIRNLSTEFPTGNYETWTQCQALFPHAKSAFTQRPKEEGSLREWASIMLNAGRYSWKKGNIAEALNLSEAAMKVREEVLGQEDQDTLESVNLVSLAYNEAGRYEEAEKLQERIIGLRRSILGEEHPETLASINNLALIYSDLGRLVEAEKLNVRVLEIRKRMLGEEHPDTLRSMNNLALIYCDLGRLAEAEKLNVRVLEIWKRVLGEEHPDTLRSMNSLAIIYSNLGRLAEAEELNVRIIEIRKRVLGEEHPDTLTSINNLAIGYFRLGRLAEAEELRVRVLEIQKRVLGEAHPETLRCLSNLAWIWYKQDRFVEAIDLMGECVHLSTRVLSADHPDTLDRVKWLTDWQREQAEIDGSSAANGPTNSQEESGSGVEG